MKSSSGNLKLRFRIFVLDIAIQKIAPKVVIVMQVSFYKDMGR